MENVIRKLISKTVPESERDECFAELDGIEKDEEGTLRSASGNEVRYTSEGTAVEYDDDGKAIQQDGSSDDDGDTVTPDDPDTHTGMEDDVPPYTDWSKSELQEEADERGIEYTSKDTVADLVAALEADDVEYEKQQASAGKTLERWKRNGLTVRGIAGKGA